MANFEVAFDWMMLNEDPRRKCAIVNDPPDQYKLDAGGDFVRDGAGNPLRIGAFAISGVNSAKHPEEYAAIAAMAQKDRGPAIQAFYEANYWNDFMAALNSDEVAKREFDMAVNEGRTAAAANLQRAIITCGHSIVVDGKLGPATVAAANACDEGALVEAVRDANVQHYRDIVAKDVSKAKFLGDWLARARK